MSKENAPTTRTIYYLAEQDEVGRPHWEEYFSGQMLYGLAEQELVDGTDWLTYRLILDIGFEHNAEEIRESEGSVAEIEFVSREELIERVKKN